MLTLAFRHDIGADARYLIAKFAGAPVHVALIFSEGEEYYPHPTVESVCIEAVFSGVRVVSSPSRLAEGDWTLIHVPLSGDALRKARHFANHQIGKPYDFRGSVFSWWFGRTEKSNNGKWNCSELAAAVLPEGGISLQPSRAASYTPRSLYDTIKPWGVHTL